MGAAVVQGVGNGCREQVSSARSDLLRSGAPSCAFIGGNRLRLTNEIKPGLLSGIAKNRRWMRFTGGGASQVGEPDGTSQSERLVRSWKPFSPHVGRFSKDEELL